MEFAKIELRTQFLLRTIAKFPKLELAKFIAESLSRPRDVAVGFRLNRGLVDCARFPEELHYLIPAPAFGMDSGVDHKAVRAEQLGRQAPVIGNRILIEADFLSQLLRVKSPPFGVCTETQAVQTEFWQSLQLLLD